jgi:hypothetical protein
MWLVSEVGELVEAYCELELRPICFPDGSIDETKRDEIAIYGKLCFLVQSIKVIENHVARREGWTRNNQPKGTYDIPGEIGDTLMMLEKFAEKMQLPESGDCLRAKMERKLRECQK